MKAFAPVLLALSLAAAVFAQEVPEGLAPDGGSPEGCVDTIDGNFTIGVLQITSKGRREINTLQAAGSAVQCTLNDGVLKDPYGRVGSIVANYQFQFDGPPQAGAIYTGGFSVCTNNSLALGPSTIFWRCTSGEFMNLYDRNVAAQCVEANIVIDLVDKPTPSSSSIAPSSTHASSSKVSSTEVSSSVNSSSSSVSATPIVTASKNGTLVIGTLSGSGSGSTLASRTSTPSASGASATASLSDSTGGALPTRVPKRETFGAVIGILGAALML
ncbi:hypothetical protein P154DRAFT_587934 [Amniculicola lignicola CBS 123094]|uniref:Cell wall mannoprotein PIR1-like C-terminal domain-containing protein n=1 Tax=Amniculicola lignicola CBS 123094 TaxID=1392246 RepID=A0A6A5WU71_9PLEO|nr:hypothetical protein P154DRAFT_587934 [Amniculicola lignicola CBS 123094]